jgi:hypothetical protein
MKKIKDQHPFDAHDIRCLSEKHQENLGHSEWSTTKPDSPTFNPGMFKVAIKGAPMFPKKGKAQESPWEGVPWLVSSRNLAMTFLCTGSSLAGLFMSEKVSHTDSGEPVV